MTPATSALLVSFLEALPGLIQAGVEVVTLITSTVAQVKSMIAENRDPTPAEWDALHAKIAALSPGRPSPFPQYSAD
ncbi:MAG: hypothetical protein ACT4OG_09900 [Alphaproteobacteria bacterium]